MSRLLGLLDPLFNILTDVVMSILNPVFTWIMEYIVGPIMAFVMSLVMWALSLALYSISCFLLGLVDFVEMLFRLLAGLPTDGVQLTVRDSTSDSPDLLVQLIQTDIVQQAFLSMCIVGLFLLVITTIFQMIRVEYTSEGAKNAKGPILEKAFKAICNLVLVPIVTIFGIYLGNSVLDLLDTATKGAENASISGALFMAAAGDAFYEKPAFTGMYAVFIPSPAGIPITALFDAVMDALEQGGAVESEYLLSEDERFEIEQKFLTGEVKYFDIIFVSSYFVMADINWLLLLFGACFAIKCLWHAAFGMVSRLYYCVIYFIISPIVMGMSVIKDNIASWRSKFIGKALSAYGVVMALNIFFIVVRVLLRVDLDFTGGGSAMFFDAVTMTLLLKGVFVLSGCVMIEKFSGELGSYFGAEDGLATGKALANDVGKEATKGVKLAAQAAMVVGSGGAGGALMAAKGAMGAVGGVASKIGKPVAGMAKNVAGSYAKAGKTIAGGAKKVGGGIATGAKAVGHGVATGARKVAGVVAHPLDSLGKAKDGIVSGAKTIGGGFATGAKAVGHGFAKAGGAIKDGTVSAWHAGGRALSAAGDAASRFGHRFFTAEGREDAKAVRDEARAKKKRIDTYGPMEGEEHTRKSARRAQRQAEIASYNDDIASTYGEGAKNNAFTRMGVRLNRFAQGGKASTSAPTADSGIAEELPEVAPTTTSAPASAPTTSAQSTASTPTSSTPSTSSSSAGGGNTTVASTPGGGYQVNTSADVQVNAQGEEKKGNSDADKKRRSQEDEAAYHQEAAYQMGKRWMDSLLGATPLKGILDADKEYHEGAKSGLGASDTGKQILQNHEKLESEKAEAALDGRHAAYKAKRESEMAKLLADELSSAFKKSTEELRQTLENIDKAMKDLSDGKGIYAGVKKDSDFYQQEMSRLNKESQEISGKIQMQVDFDPSQIAEALKGAGGNLDPKVLQDAIAKQFQKYGETGQKEMLKRIAEIIQKTMQDLGK